MSNTFHIIDPSDITKISEIFLKLNFSKCVNADFEGELPYLKEAFEKAYHDFKYHPVTKSPIRKIDQYFLLLSKAVQNLFDALSLETQLKIEKQLEVEEII